MIHIGNLSVQEFEAQLNSGISVVSFGAGQALCNLCKQYTKLAGSVIYAADNYKAGTIELDGYTIPIRRMDQCEKSEGVIFLISSLQYAMDIIRQLDQIEKYDGLDVYVPALFEEEAAKGGTDCLIFKSDGEQLIPKKIHYCWFGGGKIPQKFKENIATWRKFCPDYEIVRWDEDNYDVTKNLYMKQAYEAKQWGFVSDYARLDIINTYGGIYLDTDVELLKPLDDLLQFSFFCGFENPKYIAFGLGFGGRKGSVILRDMLHLYEQMAFINRDGTLNKTPCPTYQTQVMEAHGLVRNGQTQITRDFAALSMEYLNPVNFYGVGQPTANSFSIHQFAATWFDDRKKEYHAGAIQNCKYILERLRQNP